MIWTGEAGLDDAIGGEGAGVGGDVPDFGGGPAIEEPIDDEPIEAIEPEDQVG